MKKCIFSILVAICVSVISHAQDKNVIVPEGYVLVDSLVYTPLSGVEEELQGRNIFSLVTVRQSRQLRESMEKMIQENADKPIRGWRIRIFFDNKQDSRTESESAMKSFKDAFPGIAAYRTFANPFFKVTVGDFRTKSEALPLLNRVKERFPSAFVIKENINYPIVDKKHYYKVDTLHVLRPVAPPM